MAKQNKNQAKQTPAAAPPNKPAAKQDRPAQGIRVLISLAAVWHLFVVFISPLSVPPASQMVVDLAQSKLIRWYSDSLYLNHGYHFFGPEPPINQLVRYQVSDNTGQPIAEGEFPNTDQQWPRLYYHRHMMLADQANLGPPDISPEDWTRFSMQAYGRHLLRKTSGDRVRIDCVRHNLLYPSQSIRGDDPNAQDLFVPVVSVEVVAAELEQPLPIPALPEPELPFESIPMGDSL